MQGLPHRQASLAPQFSFHQSLFPSFPEPFPWLRLSQFRASRILSGRKSFRPLSPADTSGFALLCESMTSRLVLELQDQLVAESLQRNEFEREIEPNLTALCPRPLLRSKREYLSPAIYDSIRAISAFPETSISCTTFNILAPIYKRVNSEGCRESEFRESWFQRNENILQMLLSKRSSIICLQVNGFYRVVYAQYVTVYILECLLTNKIKMSLTWQEFWLENKELVQLYQDTLGDAGYDMFKLARSNNRGDGLFTAIRSDTLKCTDYREIYFHDCGDRVAQLLHLQSRVQMHKKGRKAEEMLLVNTHLLFPHDSNFCLIRLRQVYKIIEYLEEYKIIHKLSPIPVILCGDWNGSKRGHVYKFLRSQGFVSSYDIKHEYTDNDADAHRWISHRNHRGNVCGVDFIWLFNPNKDQKPLSISWKEAIYSLIKAKLQEVGLRGRDAFCFFKTHQNFEDYLAFQEFEQALHVLGLTRQHYEGLTREEIEDLFQTADVDGNGVIDVEEFLDMLAPEPRRIWSKERSFFEVNKLLPAALKLHDDLKISDMFWDSFHVSPVHTNKISLSKLPQEEMDVVELDEAKVNTSQRELDSWSSEEATVLNVDDASLFPPEVEQGRWPEDYSLSDHATLTAVFSPR